MKTKKALKISLMIFTLFYFSSCISYLQLSKTYPPEIRLHNGIKSIQYISGYDFTKLDFDNEKRMGVYASGLDMIKDGLQKSFEINEDYLLFVNDSIVRKRALNAFPLQMSPDSVKQFCRMNSSDLLLVLDTYDIYYDKEIERYQDDDGEKRKEAHYYLVVQAGFSLYENSGSLIDRSYLKLDQYIDSRDVIALNLAIRPSFANKQNEVDRMSFDIGRGYIDKFYPYTVPETRMYYTSNDFSEVTPYMMSKDWGKAIKLLLPMADSDNKKLSKRAAHNLAVAYEGLGEMERVDYWMERAVGR